MQKKGGEASETYALSLGAFILRYRNVLYLDNLRLDAGVLNTIGVGHSGFDV